MDKRQDKVGKIFKAPRGTQDYLPEKATLLHHLDLKATELFEKAGYRRIVTPTFEETGLFQRSIGESSDIVRKEMYTFEDRKGRSLTLRPEATAPVVRAYIERNLQAETQPVKLFYLGPMYRYERPQAGRYREFWQLGMEAIGSKEALIDAEVIIALMQYLYGLGLKEITLHVGSMGDDNCRAGYVRELKSYLEPRLESFCEDCKERIKFNALRVFDCKKEPCKQQLKEAPKLIDHLCLECDDHFESVKRLLKGSGIEFVIDPTLVRGFDYYTRTTFEVKSPLLGAQDALGGGGRYDRLVEQYGGPDSPAIGFALGIERIILALEKEGVKVKTKKEIDLFVVAIDDSIKERAFKLLCELREAGFSAEMDYLSRSIRAQMKLADKSGAGYVLIVGPDELKRDEIKVKEMRTGAEQNIEIDRVASYLLRKKEDGE